MIIKAKTFLSYRMSPIAVVTGTRRDGTPTARFYVVERREGEIFRVPPDTARSLLAEGSAAEARLTGKLAALAEATLDAESPLAAVLAGLTVSGVRTWHAAVGDRGHWRPSAASIGPTRSGFDAYFRSEAEAAARWAAGEASTPLFSFLVEAGFRRAFIWRNAGLREIATEINMFKGS
ncbi:hypothetical protein EOD23_00965 [Mesorhizobium sp. USDA-HM6]|nr:hypothetical protein EOD23_00965 [Mesorhizobium sp. USDA-HM6]